jgi:hypothetical protein
VSQNLITSNAITPSEVREALRRYTQPIGPFADFSVTLLNFEGSFRVRGLLYVLFSPF